LNAPIVDLEGGASLRPGDMLPPLIVAPLTRATCALFAGASGDHNPIHIDIDAARDAGLPDVIGHGMLSMALVARLVTDWVPRSSLRSLDVRFMEPMNIGDAVTCSGRVARAIDVDGARLVHLEVEAVDQHGKIKISGEASIALHRPHKTAEPSAAAAIERVRRD
jgi:acyl dehydratase